MVPSGPALQQVHDDFTPDGTEPTSAIYSTPPVPACRRRAD
ncbi:hypothetical protein [Streptomyces sp. NPDC102282]